MKTNYIIAAIRPWNEELFKEFFGRKHNFHLISRREDLTIERVRKIAPRYIFFPHWSWIIPEEIWSEYECVVFHMTDLPYGRGGSPLQNLISRGHKKTKMSALRVDGGLDTGPIYLKRAFSLKGDAEAIYRRASRMVFKDMIPRIVSRNPQPRAQAGKVVSFSRRTPADSRVTDEMSLEEIYDLVRMLDAPGYPKAFIEGKGWRMELTKAKRSKSGLSLSASIQKI